jgi:hypothetical protein
MGLNPPFGVRGALANQFVNHALKFKPKLLVLIAPKETARSVELSLSEDFSTVLVMWNVRVILIIYVVILIFYAISVAMKNNSRIAAKCLKGVETRETVVTCLYFLLSYA